MDNLPTLAQTVRDYDLSANKKLGQHFLLDINITDKIARLAQPFDGYTIIEIGPGPGGLTRSLFRSGATDVKAIEMDERFLPPLLDIVQASDGRLDIIKGDALQVDMQDLTSQRMKIVANLPYNVGTKLLLNWLMADPLFWSQAVLMFQKEVAQRVVAQPGNNAYGRLAVLSQSVCQCHMAFHVPAHAFSPPPKVDSAVVVLEPYDKDTRYPDLKLLGRVTQAAFGQRRKMLRKSLKNFAQQQGITAETWLERAGIEPTRRPETLSVQEFHQLTNLLADA